MDFRYIVITLLSSITLITYSLNDIKLMEFVISEVVSFILLVISSTLPWWI